MLRDHLSKDNEITYLESVDTENLENRRNYGRFLEYLIEYPYKLERERIIVKSEEVDKVPNTFKSPQEYKNTFQVARI